jgi:hypothetical protein
MSASATAPVTLILLCRSEMFLSEDVRTTCAAWQAASVRAVDLAETNGRTERLEGGRLERAVVEL